MWKRPGLLAAVSALAFAALQARSSSAEGPKDPGCKPPSTAVERLVCDDPSLAALDAATKQAFQEYESRAASTAERDARLADQRVWLDGRETACPTRGNLPWPRASQRIAIGCLSRIYEQRIAELSYEKNNAAWPRVRFRPRMVEGAGTKLCESLEHDLWASFLGPGPSVNPLGEREIGFAAVPALGDDPVVLRADVDLYNRGRPFPVLQWVTKRGGSQPAGVEYRAFASAQEFLAAIGRGGDPLSRLVHDAAHPVIDIGRLPALTRAAAPVIGQMPRFFRYDSGIYMLAPTQPAPGKPGDLGVYRFSGPTHVRRLCLFAAHAPPPRRDDNALSSPEVSAFERAAGPLLPAGKLCDAPGDEARALKEQALWRPWVLEQRRSPGSLSGDRLALYMRNRALTGPETARQYRAYVAARTAAVEALAPYYRRQFGRAPAKAYSIAALYLDQLIADGFEVDPDDESIAGLFAPDYAARHRVQQAALTGETDPLRAALGPEPQAVAKGVKGDLEESLVADALEHTETLRALLDMGFDADDPGASGRTPLMVAARLDLVEAAAILLTRGAAVDRGASDAVAQTDVAGDALCMKGSTAPSDTPGRTTLSYAVEFASPEMVQVLLEHGADPTKADDAGRRPVDYLERRNGGRTQSIGIATLLK